MLLRCNVTGVVSAPSQINHAPCFQRSTVPARGCSALCQQHRAAAGSSSRFKDKHYKKPFAILGGRAVWLHSAERFLDRDDVKQCILVISPEDREDFQMKFGANVAILGIDVVDGGAQRCDSVANGLEKVRDDIDYVVVHDAARACLADEWIEAVFTEATIKG